MKNTREMSLLKQRFLKKIPTCFLVKELEKREGVETTVAKPNEDVTVTANGAAIILTVVD